MTGVLYFFVIVFANTIGAVSGMGGGVLIKPIFDLIGAHPLVAISFYSTVAVFTMSIVSTYRQIRNGIKMNWQNVFWISFGSILGGIFGNLTFEGLINVLNPDKVQLIQIGLTIFTLLFAFLYSKYPVYSFTFKSIIIYLFSGFGLGFLASLLGIGGGPINVAILMLLFSLPIKEATVYSIGTILFSQLSKLVTIGVSTGFLIYDLKMLWFIIPAAFIGGYLGAKLSGHLSEEKVTLLFQFVILLVLVINLYNGIQLF